MRILAVSLDGKLHSTGVGNQKTVNHQVAEARTEIDDEVGELSGSND